MARILPHALQVKKFEDLFCGLNPPCDDLDLLDVGSVVDKSLSYRENLGALREEYPQYAWVKGEIPTARTYEKQIIEDLRSQASEFSYDIVKGYKVKDLERKARKLGRTEKALEVCRIEGTRPRKSIPGTCKIPSVAVKAHRRCLPRR